MESSQFDIYIANKVMKDPETIKQLEILEKTRIKKYNGIINWFVGEAMRSTKGSANPQLLAKIFRDLLEKD